VDAATKKGASRQDHGARPKPYAAQCLDTLHEPISYFQASHGTLEQIQMLVPLDK
jgi:hypothetical protein